MSTDLTVIHAKEVETSEKLGIDVDVYRALKNSLFPDASDLSIGMYLAYCRAKSYDPLKKPMHIVPIGCKTGKKTPEGKDEYQTRDVIMPGIVSYRIDAARTGTFYGISDAEFGPMVTGTFGKNNIKIDYPEWCRLVIYKKIGDVIREIPAKLYWRECYASAGAWTDEPNRMWAKRPRAMLEKCCEALAYRKGFPEEIGALPTHEEMQGRQTMDDLPGEKDITAETNALSNKPLSQGSPVDENLLEEHLTKIRNSMNTEDLKAAYTAAGKEFRSNKEAVNKISAETRERKKYIAQLDATEKENKPVPVSDHSDFLKQYEAGKQI